MRVIQNGYLRFSQLTEAKGPRQRDKTLDVNRFQRKGHLPGNDLLNPAWLFQFSTHKKARLTPGLIICDTGRSLFEDLLEIFPRQRFHHFVQTSTRAIHGDHTLEVLYPDFPESLRQTELLFEEAHHLNNGTGDK
jgi:hypothetical protein